MAARVGVSGSHLPMITASGPVGETVASGW
jgi:hypothetical protein